MKNINLIPQVRLSSIISFSLSFIGVTVISLLTSAGFHPFTIVVKAFSPQIKIERSILDDKITPLLKNKANDFKIKQGENIKKASWNSNDEVKSYAVVDFQTGNVLSEKSFSERLSIASLTKLMSAVVAMDLAPQNELFTVEQKAAHVSPTRIGVVVGEKMKLSELLNAMLLTSANDASEVVRDGIDKKFGGKVFVNAMNKKAEFLGLTDTHFSNPQGFDSSYNYSTAKDLAVLAHYALSNYALIAEIVKKDYQFLPKDENHKQFDLYNWNGLLGVYPGIEGVKIGNTDAAETTSIVVAERNKQKVIAVVLGAKDIIKRDLIGASLLNIGFEKLTGEPPVIVSENDLRNKYSKWRYWN